MEEILASIREIISDDDKPETKAADTQDGQAPELAAVETAPDLAAVETAPEEPAAEQAPVDAPEEGGQGAEDSDIFELTDAVEEPAPEVEAAEAAAETVEFDAIEAEPGEPEAVAGHSEPEAVPDFDDGDITFVDAVEAAPEPEQPEDLDIAAAPEDAAPAAEPEPETAPAPEMKSADMGMLSPHADEATAIAFRALTETLLSQKGSTRTLEDLLHDLLRPMLKSWLDENLPQLTEQLVREEIERISRRGVR